MQTRILSTSDGAGKGHDTESTANKAAAETDKEAAAANERAPKPSIKQALLAAVFAAAIVTIILLAFSWPTVTSEPKDLPIAAVGDQEQIDQVVSNAPDGMLDLKKVDSRAEAQQLIREREVYGAFVLGDEPEILTSTAASPPVAQQLNGIATQMQQKIDKQAISGMHDGMKKMQKAMAASQGPGGPQGNPGDQAQAPAAPAMEVPQVMVTDVVPLNDNDSTGAGLAIAGLPLTIGGIVGGVLTSMIVHSRRMRAVAVVAYGAIGGLALTLVLQSWFGILQGNFGLNMLAAGLAVAATAALINGFVSLIGPGGIAIGAVLTMFIGNPIASLQAPKEFLAGAWGDIGQFLVPGASGTLLRDLSYFPDAPMAMQWWVLIGWFVLGIVLILVGHLKAHSRKRVAVS
ncbi:hypothetical protein BSP239C_00187 [Brevibacterium sp. 239c]|uniref:hypothetical protein n=1 Tax=Brevibacterium sp. 239c TaxID=1965356 RepID=UPI000C69FDD3|nr:hypothetical protein [Brevibacterium sp. 239c]SMX68105.1 hypothetical protein BSP239C_00187 [Brevibacterium sp. 239c]